MNVKEIVEAGLKTNGYDGLYNDGTECACKVGDLMWCGEPSPGGCEAGYKIPCTCGEGCRFHIGPKPPEVS